MAGGGGEEIPLQLTPTWAVAVVCAVIVFISVLFERGIHKLGTWLKEKKRKPLFHSLDVVKEELMLLGFISLLLTVFQGPIGKICIPPNWTRHMLPCKKEDYYKSVSRSLYQAEFVSGVLGSGRHLLAAGGGSDYCLKKGKVPLMTPGSLHKLHIFIFVLVVVHVLFTVVTVLLGIKRVRQWKGWEAKIQRNENHVNEQALKIFSLEGSDFIIKRYKGPGWINRIRSWWYCFFRQFYNAISESDFATVRLCFIATNCPGCPTFNFAKYMIRVLESDFKKVVGIRWYLWFFVLAFLLLNVDGWHTYTWIGFIPLILLLAIGAKLERVISLLAKIFVRKNSNTEHNGVVKTSDDYFWFRKPQFLLGLLHFILFQNAYEIAYLFWIVTTYGVNSCSLGRLWYTIARVVIALIILVLSSYSTLPLYALVTQMGGQLKHEIFDDHVRIILSDLSKKVKKRKEWVALKNSVGEGSQTQEMSAIVPASMDDIDVEILPEKMEDGDVGSSEVQRAE